MALSDPMGILAAPFTIISYEDDGTAIEAIVDLVDRHQAERIIVGLPPCIIAAAELLVPRSIPIILSAIFYHLFFNYFF